jgi:hypothetical protein
VAAGDYDLVNLVLDFAPGAEIPLHYHGGPALVVGKDGVLTLRPEGGMEHTVSSGQVVNEKAGARHVMINTGSADAGIFAGVLLPKGAELTTLVNSSEPTGMPSTGQNANPDWLSFAAVLGFLLLATGVAVRLPNAIRARKPNS